MKGKFSMYILFSMVSAGLLLSYSLSFAQKTAPEPVKIKLEGAKMAPVTFSHATHADKAKIDCVICHHKDKDAKEPANCLTCHPVKDAKDNAPLAKDAFHTRCQGCHKDNVSKGKTAPTKCNECHKK